MYRKQLYLYLIILATLFSCKTVTHHAGTRVNYLNTDSYYPADKKVEELIAPYKAEMSEEMDAVIGNLGEDLHKTRPNSNLGNWFTDILYEEANKMFYKEVDFAMQNYGGLRIPILSKGELTKGKIYELMPFDNTLVVLDIDGKTVQKLADHIAARGGWPISKNFSFAIKNDKAVNVTMKGEAIDPAKIYRLAIPDYIADGGDSSEFLKSFPKEESGVFIREVLIVHLENLKDAGKDIIIDNSKRIN